MAYAAAAAGTLTANSSETKMSMPIALPKKIDPGDMGELSNSVSVPRFFSRTMELAGKAGTSNNRTANSP